MIQGGWVTEGLKFLSGAPTQTVTITSNKCGPALADWTAVNTSFQSNYILSAATPCTGPGSSISMLPCHAYTILATYQVHSADNKTISQLYKMRNPWGYDASFSGLWADGNSVWSDTTNNYAGQVNYVNNPDDGIFFI